ncbi:MAG: ABC transporter ATP-binding protein [Nitrospira sp.]|jgi:putative ABC transport system ATP-binding protein|nr:ABC transporter ATP-binding protein [Nitrospira sp.]MBS0173936.1 ABC transporter ATP-binding protein [Nitrospira sp.]MCW5778191.1 ABC transporter ATP-binding protein [Nitrospira sp.]HMZ56438.1 ABC transporter ATP-binding protein [Nitrospira sp.]HNK16406.1 ABC transporter ATP-binding protein [Nitrospira sp.]
MVDPVVSLQKVTKSYSRAGTEVSVLQDLSFDIPAGTFLAIMGPSGSGKSTLLNVMAGIDRPTSGSVVVAGTRLDGLSEGEMARWRARHIGYVFQTYNLIPVLTAAENVELPLALTHLTRRERADHVKTALRLVGLGDRMDHYPRQLSGGQEQRVGVARAIVSDPTMILADEPTGNLDRESADDILTLLARLNRELGKTIVMVTHDPRAAERAQMIRHLEKGVLELPP